MIEVVDYNLFSIIPEAADWVYIDPGDDKRPIEESLLHGGKWVVYGSRKYIETLAKSLKHEVGESIEAMKYSVKPTKVTPNAPKGKYALLVYCDERRRDITRNTLESKGVKEVAWKYDRESLMELLDEPFFCFRLELLNPGILRHLNELFKIEIKPEILEHVQKVKQDIKILSQRFSSLAESLEHADK